MHSMVRLLRCYPTPRHYSWRPCLARRSVLHAHMLIHTSRRKNYVIYRQSCITKCLSQEEMSSFSKLQDAMHFSVEIVSVLQKPLNLMAIIHLIARIMISRIPEEIALIRTTVKEATVVGQMTSTCLDCPRTP
jgi:hypothetical protein